MVFRPQCEERRTDHRGTRRCLSAGAGGGGVVPLDGEPGFIRHQQGNTLAGLSHINRESIDAIRTAVWELEKAGYITRRQGRDEKGKMTAIEYTIYEQPQPPELEKPILEKPTAGNPVLENPTTGNPTSENPMQIIKEEQKTKLIPVP